MAGRMVAVPIGRRSECDSITHFLDNVAAGHGGVLLLEGEGGTGKTTLAEWALHDAAERGMATLTGRSWEMSQSVPYEPIVAALGRFLRTTSTQERERLTGGLSSLSALLDGLDLPAPVGAEISRARLHDSVATLLARIAADRPVILLLDDLHWCDISSLELLQFVCRDFPFVALGMIGTVRPADADDRNEVRSFLAPLRRAAFCSSVSVRNLDRAQTTALLTDRLQGRPPDRLVDLVWARSIGTPLLVHEMVEDLLGRGVLIKAPHGWALTDADPPLPRAASDLIQDRIGRAQATERSLLDILAVADEPTSLDVLVTVSGLSADEVEDRLRRLIAIRLVAEVVEPGSEPRWHVEHPIIAHVVASDLDQLVLQRLHRQLLAATPHAPVARRARHVLGGGPPVDPVTALDTLIDAADVAFRQGASVQAIENYQAALSLAESIEDDAVTRPRLLDIRQGLGLALTRIRRIDEAIDVLEQAWHQAIEDDLVDEQIRAITSMDSGAFLAGDRTEIVIERLDELADRFERHEDWNRLTEVRFQQFLVLGRDGQRAALDHIRESLAIVQDRAHGARARQMIELLRLSQWFSERGTRRYDDQVGDLVEVARAPGDWDLRRRAGLMAIDLAAHVGRPELIDLAIGATREVEAAVGERPNWRIPVQRAIAAVSDGQDFGDMDDLMRVGQLDRARSMIGLVEAIADRYRHGPAAALARFDANFTENFVDPVAETYVALSRVVLAEGSDRFEEAARRALEAPVTPGLVTLFTLAHFDLASLLSAIVAGTTEQRIIARENLSQGDANRTLPDAWRAIADAQTTDGAERAAHLLTAATCLQDCGHRLAAAHRRIEAAEADRASVSDDIVIAAGTYAASCGASWVAERAAALSPQAQPSTVRAADDALTKREWEVAVEVARGLTNREVAQELFISIRTVTSHLDHIYTKLGFSSREELTDYVADAMTNT